MTTVLSVAYEVILPIIAIAGLAAWLGRSLKPDPRALATTGLYLFGPSLVIEGIANSDMSAGEMGGIALVVVLLALCLLLLGFASARLLNLTREMEGAFLLGVVLINAGNYGLPLVDFAFGTQSREVSVLIFVTTSVISNTLGVFLASRGAVSVREALSNVFKVPLPYATALGFAINFGDLALPVPLERTIGILAQATIPVMLVLLGLQISRMTLTQLAWRWRPVGAATVLRLIAAPLIVWGLTVLMGFDGLPQKVLIVQLSMPSAVASIVLATEFGSDVEQVTMTILVTTLASVVSLSVLLALVGA